MKPAMDCDYHNPDPTSQSGSVFHNPDIRFHKCNVFFFHSDFSRRYSLKITIKNTLENMKILLQQCYGSESGLWIADLNPECDRITVIAPSCAALSE